MRRIVLQLGTGLITFCLGVGAAWVGMLVSQPFGAEIERPPVSETLIRTTIETPAATSSDSQPDSMQEGFAWLDIASLPGSERGEVHQ